MQCDRAGCEHIMCDRYSSTHGYICNDCYEEVINSVKPIFVFMNTSKHEFNEDFKSRRRKHLEEEFRSCE